MCELKNLFCTFEKSLSILYSYHRGVILSKLTTNYKDVRLLQLRKKQCSSQYIRQNVLSKYERLNFFNCIL